MSEESKFPVQISGGFIISGSFETERERQIAKAINQTIGAEIERVGRSSYERGFEDGKASYRHRTWLERFWGFFG